MSIPADVKIAMRLLKACGVPRDKLPYTTLFTKLRLEFMDHTCREIGQYDFWRLLVRAGAEGLGKRGRRK